MQPPTMGVMHVAILVCAAVCRAQSDLPALNSQIIDLEYKVSDAAQPLESVRLWYSNDQGSTWTEYGNDEDRISPIRFRAPGEGTYGFFFVLANATGNSSAPPAKGTNPQLTALIDYTPPLVQLHQIRPRSNGGEVLLEIRWTAVDANFGPRPIEILFGSGQGGPMKSLSPEPVANTGLFECPVPTGISGSIEIKLAATDRAGQRTETQAQWVELPLPQPTVLDPSPRHEVLDDAALAGSARARERAAQLFSQALLDAKGGQQTLAISRLREAVKLDPQMTHAFAEMGGMLYLLGDLDRAQGAYEIALRQNGRNRDALRGVARVLERKGQFPAAAEHLQTVLRYNPMDAEIWLQLGDVAVHRGDEVKARECYLRAAQIDPQAGTVVADARQRLALMAEVSKQPAKK